ncbi:AMP-binding enzyme [Sphingomonas sp. MMS24-JH45]
MGRGRRALFRRSRQGHAEGRRGECRRVGDRARDRRDRGRRRGRGSGDARHQRWLDEVPAAFVIPAGDETGLEARIADTCVERLAAFKRPHLVRLVDALPRSTLEKVAKAELRAMLLDER